jgi:hypothetical protein
VSPVLGWIIFFLAPVIYPTLYFRNYEENVTILSIWRLEMLMRCVAVTMKPFALKLVAVDIAKLPFLQRVKTFSSPLEALDYRNIFFRRSAVLDI